MRDLEERELKDGEREMRVMGGGLQGREEMRRSGSKEERTE